MRAVASTSDRIRSTFFKPSFIHPFCWRNAIKLCLICSTIKWKIPSTHFPGKIFDACDRLRTLCSDPSTYQPIFLFQTAYSTSTNKFQNFHSRNCKRHIYEVHNGHICCSLHTYEIYNLTAHHTSPARAVIISVIRGAVWC